MIVPGTTDVFVAGGGPAGLAAAIAARRRGMQVTLADAAVPPIDKACGEGVMPDGLQAARALGIDLHAAGARRFRGIRFHDGEASVAAGFPSGDGLGLRRTMLHRYLAEVAADAGVQLLWGAAVSGIDGGTVSLAGREVRAGWIVGADGGRSRVRRWAGLESHRHRRYRFGFRAHYRAEPWSEWMELHWGEGCQLYITPTADDEICVAVLTDDPRLRLPEAIGRFPAVARRLGPVESAAELGGISGSCRLKSVAQGRVALVGDASGSVDAITGEGLCLLFRQSAALAAALEAGDLAAYRTAHRRIARQPEFMARLMLMLARHGRLRHRVIAAMAADPRLLAGMLAAHIREITPFEALSGGLALGLRVLGPAR